jgi:hypothetical protein
VEKAPADAAWRSDLNAASKAASDARAKRKQLLRVGGWAWGARAERAPAALAPGWR